MPIAKKSTLQQINDMRFPVDKSKCGRITYRCEILSRRQKIAIFAQCILIVDTQRRNVQQYHCNIYIVEKYIQLARILQLVIFAGLITHKAVLPPKSAKSHEIPPKFELIVVQGHPRSSIVLPIERAYATSCQSLIVTTLCSEKNTHSHFLSYLHECCVDLNKNCSEYT